MNTDKLVNSWIEYQQSNKADLEWSNDDFIDLANEYPETAWECILKIIDIEPSGDILAKLAEGPFEDLLAEHGVDFLDRIESLAKDNIVLARLIKLVWVDGIPNKIQNNIRTIQSKYGSSV